MFSTLTQKFVADVILTAPFHRLSYGVHPASSTILLTKYSLPLLSIFGFLRHAYLFPALLSLVTALADPLVILAAVIPYSPGRVWIELLVSSYTCIGVLALMIICIVALVFWKRKIDLPRKPDTIAAVASYFCGTDILCERDLQPTGSRIYRYEGITGNDSVKRWVIHAIS
jgi:hypothetical protein